MLGSEGWFVELEKCRIVSWVIDCIQLCVLYAGGVGGVTLGYGVWVVFGEMSRGWCGLMGWLK